jgi:hypothetical protein
MSDSYHPLQQLLSLNHPLLSRAAVALAKTIALSFLLSGHFLFVPAHVPTQLKFTFIALSFMGCIALLFTPFTRTCAWLLATCLAIMLAVSPAYFAHNRIFALALLLCTALSYSRSNHLVRWQVALVYAVAGIDKLFTPDWRSGVALKSIVNHINIDGFMYSFFQRGNPSDLAHILARLSDSTFSFLSLLVSFFEILLAICFAFKVGFGAHFNRVFQVVLFSFTGSPLGLFFPLAFSSSLLLDDKFIGWFMFVAVLSASPLQHPYLPAAALLGTGFYLVVKRRHNSPN